MVANNGWSYFTMPTCIAPGNYLLRVELLALHSAYTSGQAQFYVRRIVAVLAHAIIAYGYYRCLAPR